MPDDFKPTEEQEAIRSAVARSTGSVMVEAGAGCAKTSTMKLASKGVRVPALGLAFNRRIADDLALAVPANVQVKTMNGLGHGAWQRTVANKLVLDERKLGKIITQTLKDSGRKRTPDDPVWEQTGQLVRVAMQQGLVPQGQGPEGLIPDSPEQWHQLATEDCDLSSREAQEVVELGQLVLREDIRLAKAGTISFDDQVYCSTMLAGRFVKFPMVLVDEDQDLSPLNIKMLGMSLAQGARLMAVGDKRQAIYAWRGASGRSAEMIRGLVREADWTELGLMTTFRCPRHVVARQQGHVPGFRAWDGAIDGTVRHFRRPSVHSSIHLEQIGQEELWAGWGWRDITAALPHPRATIAVLCRNNAPLLGFAIQLIKQGIGVQMLGRDIGKGLSALAKARARAVGLEPSAIPIAQFIGLVMEWRQSEVAGAGDNEKKRESVEDKADCLLAVAEGQRDAQGVIDALEKLFSSEGLVTLSSIHRAKGLEWDLVLHLDPWRIPSRAAKASALAGNPIPLEQEYNLKYVAETRTKHTLLLGDLQDFVG